MSVLAGFWFDVAPILVYLVTVVGVIVAGGLALLVLACELLDLFHPRVDARDERRHAACVERAAQRAARPTGSVVAVTPLVKHEGRR